ncbi:MAG TPA: Hpt domain-containing protein [Propionibacteriaceae bacterium]|jgi:HPt (histidine-containing phosphotransfer) domain-containing protein
MVEERINATQAREGFASIASRAAQSNLRRVDVLSELLSHVVRGDITETDRGRAVDIAHQLVGSAGTFGYRRVSEIAREVELFFVLADHQDPARYEAAARSLAEMERELLSPPDDPD